jgi:hypothetical protein
VPFWFARSTCDDLVVEINERKTVVEFASAGGYCRMSREDDSADLWTVHYTITKGQDVIFASPEFSMNRALLLRAFSLEGREAEAVEAGHPGKSEFFMRHGRLVSLIALEGQPAFSIFLTDDLMRDLDALFQDPA